MHPANSQRMRHAAMVLVLAALSIGAADAPDVVELANTARERAAQVTPPSVRNNAPDQERVRALAEQARARGREVLPATRAAIDAATGMAASSTQSPTARAPLAGRVVVALSSSVPEAMWRDYLAQLDGHPEAVVVLRGFVGGARTIRPTGQLVERLRRNVANDPQQGHRNVEVLVDPLLYTALGIDRVPAVAWLPGVQDIRHCDQETYAAATVVYGAVAVEAALKTIHQRGGRIPATVQRAFAGRGWEQRR